MQTRIKQTVGNALLGMEPGRILDIPAGRGWLQDLLGDRWDYHGADLYTRPGMENFTVADLTHPTPRRTFGDPGGGARRGPAAAAPAQRGRWYGGAECARPGSVRAVGEAHRRNYGDHSEACRSRSPLRDRSCPVFPMSR